MERSNKEKETKPIQPVNVINTTIMEEKKYRWKKIGGGSLRLRGQIIKPGQIFMATEKEIPAAFKNQVQSLDSLPPASNKVAASINAVKTTYTMKPSEKGVIQPHGKSKTWFDVVDLEGVVLNEKGLSKADAENLLGFDIVNQDGKALNEKPLSKERVDELLKALEG